MKIVVALVLATVMINSRGGAQSPASRSDTRNGGNMLSANECVAKGGIGIVNTQLYIDLKSASNELILNAGDRWTGHNSETVEVVFIFQNKVWSMPAAPPDGFDLSRAILVSFEHNLVRFFDFNKMSGGYYRRNRT